MSPGRSHNKQYSHRSPSTTHHTSTPAQPQSQPQPQAHHPSTVAVPVDSKSPLTAAAAMTKTLPVTHINTPMDTPCDHPQSQGSPPPMHRTAFGAGVDVDTMGVSRTFLSSSPSFDTSSPSSSSSVSSSSPSSSPSSIVDTGGDRNKNSQDESTHAQTRATTTGTVNIISSPSATLPPPPALQSDASPPHPPPAEITTPRSLRPPQEAAAAVTATASSIPILVQIEQDIAQLDGEIEDLQMKLAQTVDAQAHRKMNDLLFKTTSS